MIPTLSAEARRLLGHFSRLDEADRHALLAFAAFLADRNAGPKTPTPGHAPEAVPEAPLAIPRPPDETVVGALKRLRRTYPMVDTDLLLDEASGLMSAHLLGGRPLQEVIDELEALFERHFQQQKK